MNETRLMRSVTEDLPRGLRARRHLLYLRGGAVMFLWFAGWSFSGPTPEPTPGSPVCDEVSNATTVKYITGSACPPAGFEELVGYRPVLRRTVAGWRYTRPEDADGRCNGPLTDLGRTLEFVPVCQAHDYGYDLVRFGVGVRAEADELLYRDMMTICSERDPVAGGGCRCFAHWTQATLQIGDVSGFDPEPLTA